MGKWPSRTLSGGRVLSVALEDALRGPSGTDGQRRGCSVPVIRSWEETGSALWVTPTEHSTKPLLWEVLAQERNPQISQRLSLGQITKPSFLALLMKKQAHRG